MSEKYKEHIYTPDQYTKHGDRLIQSLPLIDTSIFKLAEVGWNLSVTTRFIRSHGYTKLRYAFYDPNKSNAFLIFNFWLAGCIPENRFIPIILEKDLKVNFNRVPRFHLAVDTPQRPKVIETELEMFERINKEIASNIPRKFLMECIDADNGKISNSSERLAS